MRSSSVLGRYVETSFIVTALLRSATTSPYEFTTPIEQVCASFALVYFFFLLVAMKNCLYIDIDIYILRTHKSFYLENRIPSSSPSIFLFCEIQTTKNFFFFPAVNLKTGQFADQPESKIIYSWGKKIFFFFFLISLSLSTH